MSGYKDYSDGNVLTAAELDGYLQRQTVMRFPTTVALTSTLGIASGVREHGMLAWADDGAAGAGALYAFSSALTAWVPWDSPAKSFLSQGNSNSVNWTNGNATQAGSWRYSGGLVHWNWWYAVGSTSNMQTGAYAFTLPVNVHADLVDGFPIGKMVVKDSPSTWYGRTVAPLGNAAFAAAISELGVRVGTTAPMAPGTGDQYSINAQYPPAVSVWLT